MIKSTRNSTKNQIYFILFIQIFMVIISLAFPHLMTVFNQLATIGNISFYMLTVLIGMITGSIFPLALNLYYHDKPDIGITAGIINAADHLGAAFGAFFSGTILLPILGLYHCSILLAAASLFTAILMVLNLIQNKSIHT